MILFVQLKLHSSPLLDTSGKFVLVEDANDLPGAYLHGTVFDCVRMKLLSESWSTYGKPSWIDDPLAVQLKIEEAIEKGELPKYARER
jgi:hypothetical protein